MTPLCFLGREQTENASPSAPAAQAPVPQALPASPAPAQPVSQAAEPKPEIPQPAAKLETPRKAQEFKFTKVDLELLRQVNAFDRYMDEKGLVYSDPEADAYLERIGFSLVPKQTPDNVKWRFRVARDLEVNAFALPNGSVYVNSGLLSRMENEAQIAGVLAHEITHVTNRHGYLEYRSQRKKMVAIDVFQAAGTFGGGTVAAMCDLLSAIVVSTILGYSRELEHEADVYAVNALYLQGYDLNEFSRG
jgi:predicted Zn-dependent protease